MNPLTRLYARYARFSACVLASLSEVERRDVHAFDEWLYRKRGWRVAVAIVAVTTLVAFVASRLPWNMSFLEAAILFNAVVVTLVWTGLTAWFGHRKFHGRVLRFTLVAMVSGIVAGALGASGIDLVYGRPPYAWIFDSAKLRHVFTALVVMGFVYIGLVALIANLRNREYAALTRHLEAEARQSALSRQLAESELKLLQSQVEPHFLFNTLGSAQQLAEKGAPEAARLIAELIRFLRAATPALRREWAPLGDEVAMVDAYLAIMRTRLGARLAVHIDVPAALSRLPVPPGMLITLVENAVKHGIEPLAGGGRIGVSAGVDAEAGQLVVEVADTGAGLAHDAPGQGIGLANVQERLKLLYGGAASLELQENEPRGFIARVRLPFARPTVADTQPLAADLAR
jgi:signal transduction histidine kinase